MRSIFTGPILHCATLWCYLIMLVSAHVLYVLKWSTLSHPSDSQKVSILAGCAGLWGWS